jgi:NET1-associated nuclear protein 1 (U3 small nucleolar RNA-associated protein 17)
MLWVACSDGRIWSVDWMTGSVGADPLVTKSKSAADLTLLPLRVKGVNQEVLVVSELTASNNGLNHLNAYFESADSDARDVNTLVTMTRSAGHIHSLLVVEGPNVLLAAVNSTLVVGVPDSPKVSNIADMTYSFYHFETQDIITALDARIASTMRPAQVSRRLMKDKSKTRDSKSPIIDVLIGGARGSIYFYNDIVTKLLALEGDSSNGDALAARKFHWHRRAVHDVKWSRDGT